MAREDCGQSGMIASCRLVTAGGAIRLQKDENSLHGARSEEVFAETVTSKKLWDMADLDNLLCSLSHFSILLSMGAIQL